MMPRTSFRLVVPPLFLVVSACGGSGGGVAAVATFGTPRSAPTNGATADGFELADVDRDGFADAMVADGALDAVRLLRGNADGTLSPGVAVPAVSGVVAVALADLDGDARLDLVTCSGASGAFAVSLGNGDGTFAAAVGAPLPWPVREALLVDVSGDGRVDLVVSSRTAAEFAVLTGAGGGVFDAAQIVSLGYLPASLVAGDFDRDGRSDLATAGVGGARIDTWRSAGGGAFLPALANTVGNQAGRLVVGDFDDDGVLDLAAVAATTGELLLLLGNGNGGFAIADAAFLPAGVVDSLAVGDFDGDGWLDVAAAVGARIGVAFGAGATWRGVESIAAGAAATRNVVGHDLGGDGRWEIVYLEGQVAVAAVGSIRPEPAGLSIYGSGSPECGGRIGMWANGSPKLGNVEFAYTVTNAPVNTFGFLLQGGPADIPGSDPFGIGMLVHVGLGFVTTELVFSDALGRAQLPRPVPSSPGLVGLPVYVQTVWQGPAAGSCAGSSLDISSSIGLVSTVQP